MNTIARRNKTLLYEDVVNDLYELIDMSGLVPGDKLPTERELTERLGISRNVLREAFHVLERRGVISSRQGKGRFLRTTPQTEVEMPEQFESITRNLERYSLLDTYEVRKALEVKAVELCVKNATDEDIATLEETYNKIEARFHETGKTAGEFEMHRLYAQKSGNQYLEYLLDLIMSTIYDMMYKRRTDLLGSHDAERELDTHRKLIAAIKERDAVKARSLMDVHLQETMDMIK